MDIQEQLEAYTAYARIGVMNSTSPLAIWIEIRQVFKFIADQFRDI